MITNVIDNISPCRPELPKTENTDELYIIGLMKQCWEHDPQSRPDVSKIKRQLKAKNKGT